MKTYTIKKTLSGLALASVFVLAGCQKEELMEEQFTQPFAETTQAGKAIPGQYIVVFKNGGTNLRATGVQALTVAGRAATVKLRERLVETSGIEKAAIQHTYEGAVNGFSARLTKDQLESLRQNPDVAYVEQDYIITLAKPETSNGNSKGGKIKDESGTKGNNGKGNNKI